VLFADVVHSMGMAAVVGAERLREIIAELVDRAMAVVQRYGATVDQFTGDGIMAVFGAPVALEDHALRACLAALEIQREVHGMAAAIDRQDGVSLRVRVGLNSGQVIAGESGSTAIGYTAIGEQVGMASWATCSGLARCHNTGRQGQRPPSSDQSNHRVRRPEVELSSRSREFTASGGFRPGRNGGTVSTDLRSRVLCDTRSA
jgi:hypothetical protein